MEPEFPPKIVYEGRQYSLLAHGMYASMPSDELRNRKVLLATISPDKTRLHVRYEIPETTLNGRLKPGYNYARAAVDPHYRYNSTQKPYREERTKLYLEDKPVYKDPPVYEDPPYTASTASTTASTPVNKDPTNSDNGNPRNPTSSSGGCSSRKYRKSRRPNKKRGTRRRRYH
jgi:hypothetical protein